MAPGSPTACATMAPGNPFDTLPPEIVQEIFASSLDGCASSYIPLSLCCKRFDGLLRSPYIISKMCIPIAHVVNPPPTSNHSGTRLSVAGSIDGICRRYSWITLYCKHCTTSVAPVEDGFVCFVCGTTSTVPRAMLRFQFVVRDASGFVPCIIFGKLAEKMLGCSTLDLYLTSSRDVKTIPPKIMDLIGQLFVFNLELDYHGRGGCILHVSDFSANATIVYE